MESNPDMLQTLFEDFVNNCHSVLKQAGVSKELGLTGKLDRFLNDALSYLSTVPDSVTVAQQPKTEFGLPDFSVYSKGNILGYVEFKGVQGTTIRNLTTAHDKRQHELFTSGLQNLIYTNGWQWDLWQDSKRIKSVTFDPELFIAETTVMIDSTQIDELKDLLELFVTFSLLPYTSVTTAVSALAHRAKALRLALEEQGEKRAGSHLSQLKQDFKVLLYRNGQEFKWPNFIDSYVQIAAFGALLWRLESADDISLSHTVGLKAGVHPLLYQCLAILWNKQSQNEFTTPLLEELVRTVNLVPVELFSKKPDNQGRKYVPDPIVNAYEPFFQYYDKRARESYGVFYTPVELVEHIISGVGALLESALGRSDGLLDDSARFLDPATGTGTFLLGLASQIAEAADAAGLPAEAIVFEVLTDRTAAFELFPGPYTIAHQRLEALLTSQGSPPVERLPIFLTDTLAAPELEQLPKSGFGPAGEKILHEREQADWIKTKQDILVILGNPPYERMKKSAGGWDKFTQALMQQVVDATPLDQRKNLKSTTDLFVAFWAWALWALQDSDARSQSMPKIDTTNAHGMVAFVTNRTWIVGPSLIGLRKLVLKGVKEVWVFDLGGDNRGGSKDFTGKGKDKDQNVFNIQTGVAIVWLVFDREFSGKPTIKYRRNFGSKKSKLELLSSKFDPADYSNVENSISFMPVAWPPSLQASPSLPDLFRTEPYTGIQSARDTAIYSPWGIEAADVYAEVLHSDRRHSPYRGSLAEWSRLTEAQRRDNWSTAQSIRSKKVPPSPDQLNTSRVRKALYRPLDERFVYDDPSWIDWYREDLHEVYSMGKVPTLVSIPRDFGRGPLVIYTEILPEQHSFNGRGGKAILPLYVPGAHGESSVVNLSDSAIAWANKVLSDSRQFNAASGDIENSTFSYILAVLSAPAYAEKYWSILESMSPSVPLTMDQELAEAAVSLGYSLREIWAKEVSHDGIKWFGNSSSVLGGSKWVSDPDNSPGRITFDNGQYISGVSEKAWKFTISGYRVLPEYFRARAGWRSLTISRSLDALKTVAAVQRYLDLCSELDDIFHAISLSEVYSAGE